MSDIRIRCAESAPSADPGQFRTALSRFATGVAVVTAGGQRAYAITVNAFTAVSLDPPVILVCLARTSNTHRALLEYDRFAISFLSAGQRWIAEFCAQTIKDTRRLPLGRTAAGTPRVLGGLAYLECVRESVSEVGDHTVFFGRVIDLKVERDEHPLLFFTSRYAGLTGAPKWIPSLTTPTESSEFLDELEDSLEEGIW